MSLAESFYEWTQAEPELTVLVAYRVYPARFPQEVSGGPELVYTVISSNTELGSPGFMQARLQIDIFGKSFAAAERVAKVLRKHLHGYRGAAGSQIWQGVVLENEQSGFDDGPNRFRLSFDARIWWSESHE